jgi:hypothetical protein
MKPAITTVGGTEISRPRTYVWARNDALGGYAVGSGDLADLAADEPYAVTPYRAETVLVDDSGRLGTREVDILTDDTNPDFTAFMAVGSGVQPEVTRRYTP